MSFLVEDLEDLLLVGLGVGVDLLAGQRLAGDVAAGGVADEGGEVADEKDDSVAELLKMAQLAHEDGVAQVQVGRGGVKAGLDAQRAAGFAALFEALAQVADADDLRCAFLEQVHLFVDRRKIGGRKRTHVVFKYKVGYAVEPAAAARTSVLT